MNLLHFDTEIRKHFPFDPTPDQQNIIASIQNFLLSGKRVLIIKGYAGTGKTSIVAALVKAMSFKRRKVVLMAPTGRAAKVMAKYSSRKTYTIHRYIYETSQNSSGRLVFNLKQNKSRNALYVVDEASMINHTSIDRNFKSGSVLNDLIDFTESGINCKIIFVGDVAQLPPVGQDESPALNEKIFHPANVQSGILRQVVRQAEGSLIIRNATEIRNLLIRDHFEELHFTTGPEFIRLDDGYEIQDYLTEAFQHQRDESILIVRSNKRANLYNRQIRARILWLEDEIAAGDLLMVVKNNYFWLDPKSEIGFIANGEAIEVLKYRSIKEFYGFRFADVVIRFPDYPNHPEMEVKILLDVLDTPGPALSLEDSRSLFIKFPLTTPSSHDDSLFRAVINNEFLNALQVKFAYAVTCHKAQGGQWKNVFVEQSWLPDGKMDREYFRWLYTAITRSTEKVYLLGFAENYF